MPGYEQTTPLLWSGSIDGRTCGAIWFLQHACYRWGCKMSLLNMLYPALGGFVSVGIYRHRRASIDIVVGPDLGRPYKSMSLRMGYRLLWGNLENSGEEEKGTEKERRMASEWHFCYKKASSAKRISEMPALGASIDGDIAATVGCLRKAAGNC